MTTATGSSRPDARAFGLGAVFGVGAWVLGYLLTYALEGSQVKKAGAVNLVEAITGQEVAWKIVGWLFYNAHFVETNVETSLFGTSAVNFIARSEGNAWVLYLVPPLVLLGAGALTARVLDRKTAAAGAKAGLLVVPAYFVLSVVGALVFAVQAGAASAAPDLLMAATLAGIIYPALFGGVGGSVGAVVANGDSVGESTPAR